MILEPKYHTCRSYKKFVKPIPFKDVLGKRYKISAYKDDIFTSQGLVLKPYCVLFVSVETILKIAGCKDDKNNPKRKG